MRALQLVAKGFCASVAASMLALTWLGGRPLLDPVLIVCVFFLLWPLAAEEIDADEDADERISANEHDDAIRQLASDIGLEDR